MEFFPETSQYLELLFNIGMAVLPTLAVAAAGGSLGWRAIRAVRTLWKWFRGHVDELDDPIIVALAKQTGRKPQEVRDFILMAGDQIVSIMPESKP